MYWLHYQEWYMVYFPSLVLSIDLLESVLQPVESQLYTCRPFFFFVLPSFLHLIINLRTSWAHYSSLSTIPKICHFDNGRCSSKLPIPSLIPKYFWRLPKHTFFLFSSTLPFEYSFEDALSGTSCSPTYHLTMYALIFVEINVCSYLQDRLLFDVVLDGFA